MLIEFSEERKASATKEIDGDIKLARNAMRTVNRLLEKFPSNIRGVYTVQCISKCNNKVT